MAKVTEDNSKPLPPILFIFVDISIGRHVQFESSAVLLWEVPILLPIGWYQNWAWR